MSDPSLTEFLLARISEDEAVARAVADENLGNSNEPVGTGDDPWPAERIFAERFTPARVLARCAADRGIVAEHESRSWPEDGQPETICERCGQHEPCATLRHLASVYAAHEDYDERWRP